MSKRQKKDLWNIFNGSSWTIKAFHTEYVKITYLTLLERTLQNSYISYI